MMLETLEPYLLFALIMWVNVYSLAELLGSLAIGWSILLVLQLTH